MKYSLTAPRDMRLSELLAEKLSFLGKRRLRELISGRHVKVRGERTGEDVMLAAGDAAEAYTSDAAPDISVVYSDDNIAVADKPAHTDTMSLPAALAEVYGELYPVHRLDVNTTGLVVLARTPEAAAELEREFRARAIKKKYLATVVGVPPSGRGTLRHWLVKDAAKGVVRAYGKPVRGGAECSADYELVGRDGELSVLALYPATGRTHQLRVQLAAAGMPVLGDGKYGDFAANRKYGVGGQMLRAVSLTFVSPRGVLAYLRGKEISVE